MWPGGGETQFSVCDACAYRGAPLIFDDATAYQAFQSSIPVQTHPAPNPPQTVHTQPPEQNRTPTPQRSRRKNQPGTHAPPTTTGSRAASIVAGSLAALLLLSATTVIALLLLYGSEDRMEMTLGAIMQILVATPMLVIAWRLWPRQTNRGSKGRPGLP